MHENPLRIAISGSYGGMNLGDEAILHSIVQQLSAALPVDITVYTHDPADTARRHAVARALDIRSLTRDEARDEVRQLDLLILGGGGILFDGAAEGFLREVALAHEVGVPVAVYAISAGPLANSDNRQLVRDCLEAAALITVRDRHARQLLEETGLAREIIVTADPALLLEPEPFPDEACLREGLDLGRQLVAFSVREPGPAAPDLDVAHYHGLLADAADFVVDRFDADVVFVPMERTQLDLQHSHAVVAKMRCPQRAAVLKGDYRSGQLLSLLGRCAFAVGMRLHFLIFAAIQGVPFVALPYASKVQGFIEDLELEMPPLSQVSAGTLLAYIDRCWDRRDELRGAIRERLPALQARAAVTRALLLGVLQHPAPAPSESAQPWQV